MGQGEKGTAGRGARVSDFFTKNPNLKHFFFFLFLGGVWGAEGVGGGGE